MEKDWTEQEKGKNKEGRVPIVILTTSEIIEQRQERESVLPVCRELSSHS